MLWAELLLLDRQDANARTFLEFLKPIVTDSPPLVAIINGRLSPPRDPAQLRGLKARSERIRKQNERKEKVAWESWRRFWNEIVQNPEVLFAPEREENTAWNLWIAMDRSGDNSRASGWSRRYIERDFGKDVADKLRQTMIKAWRKDKPTLRSERPEVARDTYLVRWQFGLAAIAAEAEDPHWAKKLSEA